MTEQGTAAERWRELLEARAIPAEILAGATDSPYRHDPARFRAPVRPADTPSREAALGLLGADGGTVLDVGCGAGAAGLALLPAARHLTGVDTAQDMLDAFEAACDERGVAHRTVRGAWPVVAEQAGRADVVVCHHVGYNTADLAGFMAAVGAAARRGAVVELTARHPTAWLDPLWERLHGLRRPPAATADDAVAVLRELGVHPRVRRWSRPARQPDPTAELDTAQRRLCLPAARRDELAAALAELPGRPRDCVTISWAATGS